LESLFSSEASTAEAKALGVSCIGFKNDLETDIVQSCSIYQNKHGICGFKKTTWQESEKSKYKEDQPVRKGRKDAKHCVFPNRCGAGVELSGGMRNQKLHAARLCFLLETRQLKAPQR